MIEETDEISHKLGLSQHKSKGQAQNVGRHRQQRLCDIVSSECRMLDRICPSEQCSSQHESALPTRRGNGFIRECLVTPDENVPFFDHSSEEILVLSSSELRSEGL